MAPMYLLNHAPPFPKRHLILVTACCLNNSVHPLNIQGLPLLLLNQLLVFLSGASLVLAFSFLSTPLPGISRPVSMFEPLLVHIGSLCGESALGSEGVTAQAMATGRMLSSEERIEEKEMC